jgi:hypothetical protein
MTVGAELPATNAKLPHQGLVSFVVPFFSYFILIAGLITMGSCAYMMVASYSSLPYWDGWIELTYAADGGNPFTLDWIWGQYNEHRMPIPKLFLLTDLHWFHGNQIFLLCSIFVIQFLLLVTLAWSMRAFGNWRGAVWRTGVGLAAFCLFCLSQWENLTWGMQVCFLLPRLFASLSMIGFVLYWIRSQDQDKANAASQSSNWKYLLLSIAGALGATWCYVDGNLLWPLLVAAALVLRLRWSAIFTLIVAGALSTALFLNNWARPAYAINPSQTHGSVLRFLAAYLGSSWVGSSSNHRMAEVIGILGLLVFGLFLLRLRTDIQAVHSLNIYLLLLGLYCVGTGIVTSFGRSGFGISQAFSSRYQSVALLFWCCLGLLLLGAVLTRQVRVSNGILLAQVVLLVIMLVGAMNAKTPLLRARVRGFKLNAAAMSLATNVVDADQLRWAFLRWDYLPTIAPYLRRERLSAFDGPIPWLLGKPLDSTFTVAPPSQCAGELEASVALTHVPGPQALRITGWAWDKERREPPDAIIAVTDGMVTGIGAMGDWRPLDKVAHPWMTTNYLGYLGYVLPDRPLGPIDIYAILKGNPEKACLIANTR